MKQRFGNLVTEIRLLQEDLRNGTHYFSQEEHNETLRKGKTMANENFTTRDYTYSCSGAIYSGEWLGGMRHG